MEAGTKSIVIRIKQGDKAAFKLLYDRYAPLVFDLAYKLLQDRSAAEEIVQDCFVKIWNARSELYTDRDIWPFIYVSAKRLCYNQWRRASVIQKYQDQVGYPVANDVEEKIDARELEVYLEASMDKLPAQQKIALQLSRMDGCTHQEIAREMGISPNTVKNHITQALKSLRKFLTQADYNYLFLFFFLIKQLLR